MYSYLSSQFHLFDILMLKITHRPRSSLTFTQYPVHLIFGSKKPVTSSCMLGIFKKKRLTGIDDFSLVHIFP